MVTRLIMIALCTVGVLFYIRFFVALCKDGKRRDGNPSWLCRLLSIRWAQDSPTGYDLISVSAARAGAPRRVLPFEKSALVNYVSEDSRPPLQSRNAAPTGKVIGMKR